MPFAFLFFLFNRKRENISYRAGGKSSCAGRRTAKAGSNQIIVNGNAANC